jgi:hypothetical protein
MACTAASLISSIALVPAGALLMRTKVFNRGLMRGGLYVGAWIASLWILVVVVRFYGLARLPPWQVILGISSLMLTFSATLMLTAAIARGRGYRLMGRRDSFSSGRGPG